MQQVRILIDSGSEVSLISESLVTQLRLKRQRSTLDVHGVGDAKASRTNGVVNITLHSNYRPLSVTIQAHVLKKVTVCLPSEPPTLKTLPSHLEKLNLADPQFLVSRPVDIILGADAYGQIIKPNIIRHASTLLIAQLSIFGWLVIGPVEGTQIPRRTAHQVTVNNTDHHLSELISRFWIQEEPPQDTTPLLTPEEQECEEHFKNTHSRDSTGRYIVRLPFKLPPRLLGDSYQTAHNCLQRTRRRLSKDAQYNQLYTKFMQEYEQLGHMVRLNHNSITSSFQYYLPHHGVLKLDSKTTALRVVFNGSSPTSSGYALNDLLHTGPNLMLNIADLLIWLRRYRHLFATDITKMYRQIKVHPDDWSLQQILWLDDAQQETLFQLTTVTYGTKAAPFLAVRSLLQLAEDEGAKYPLAVEPIKKGRYVDDIFGGADTVEHLIQVATQLTQLCQAGGFPLAKWHSTSKPLLDALATEENNATISFDDCETKILGIKWTPHQDTFNFATISASPRKNFSKRIILSEVAQIFDPLGFVAPIVIRAKILIQELWLQKLAWDDPLPLNTTNRWLRIREDLTSLAKLSIPRWFNTTSTSTVELHGFADASVFAMAAVVYLVVRSPSTGTHTSLVCSKTRVTPLKRLTIPRLELTAALLLSKLVRHVYATLNMTVSQTFLWTDSEVTLAWIKTHPSKWKDYVRNRVIQIQEITQDFHWRHVPGTSNPADCASRGMTTDQLQQHSLWWTGPPWLKKTQDAWPTQTNVDADELGAPEARSAVSLHTTNAVKEYSWDLIYKYSSFNRLLRITSLCLKFVNRLRKRHDDSSTLLISAADIEKARLYWIQATQSLYFKDELAALAKGTSLSPTHPFTRLTAYLDHQGIARVGGRLQHSELSHEGKHPAILPRDSRLSALIIDHAHQQTMHGGTQSTLAFLRQRYWIIGGRAPVKTHILRCVKCARQRGIRAHQLMGQLPLCRVTPSRPFTHTGVDYAGPLTLKTWKGRGAKTHKGWICVFVCFATSAVHLEVVSDYSTEAFIAAYRRFTSRRGIAASLYSDCGTNFQGADAQLKRYFADSTRDNQDFAALLANDGTQWHFNPPAAPHMGGKWEAVVKSLKFHLKRTIGDASLTYEESVTFLAQVEAILNSRPLEPLSDDPDDVSALSPGHFLIGTQLNAVPEPALLDIATNRLSRWQFIQQRIQQFWKLWSTQYLQRLQAISKWHHPSNQIKVGSLVLVTDERLPPGKWPMARVLKLFPGKDGLTRVVELKTATTTLTRPIAKLALLHQPTTDNADTQTSSSTSR